MTDKFESILGDLNENIDAAIHDMGLLPSAIQSAGADDFLFQKLCDLSSNLECIKGHAQRLEQHGESGESPVPGYDYRKQCEAMEANLKDACDRLSELLASLETDDHVDRTEMVNAVHDHATAVLGHIWQARWCRVLDSKETEAAP